jgi:hypothetical protein
VEGSCECGNEISCSMGGPTSGDLSSTAQSRVVITLPSFTSFQAMDSMSLEQEPSLPGEMHFEHIAIPVLN